MGRDAGEFQSLRPFAAGTEPGSPRRGDRSRARVESDAPEPRIRGVGELLDLSFDLLRSRFGTYVGVAAAIWIPVRIAQPFIGVHTWYAPGEADPTAGVLIGFSFNLLATIVVSFLGMSVLSLLAASHFTGRPTSVAAAIRGVLSRSFSILVIAVLCGVLVTIGWLCCCIPGVLLSWLLYLAPAVCVLEGAGIPESVSRSFELSWPRLLTWLGLALVAYLVRLPFESLAGIVDAPEVRAWMVERLPLSPTVFDWTFVGFSSLFLGVGTAIRGVVVTVWYFDCRAYREGADLQARLARAAGAASPIAEGAS